MAGATAAALRGWPIKSALARTSSEAGPGSNWPLLSVHTERLHRRCSDKSDNLPPPHSITSSAAAAFWSGSAGRLHRVLHKVGGDFPAHRLADLQRVAEVDAAPDPHVGVLAGELADVLERPRQLRVRHIDRRKGDRWVRPEHRFEDADRKARDDRRLRGVFRMH